MKTPIFRFKGHTGDWGQRKFGDMFKRRMERNGGQFDKSRWISVAKMFFQDPEKVTSNNIDTRTYVMRKGDIAFEGHHNSEYKYGRFVENDIGDGVISELFPIYQHIDEYDLNYWKYAIQLESVMQSRLVKCIEISYTSSNKLEERSFLKESVLVPPFDEQVKIGSFLSNLDNLIALNQRKCEALEELKKGMLQKMFPKNGKKVPEFRFKGFTGDWEQRKCEKIIKNEKGAMKIGPFGSALKKEFYIETGVKVYAQENIFAEDFNIGNYYISEERYKSLKSCKLEPGDLVISMMGTIGACAIFPNDAKPGIMNSHLLRLQLADDICPEYIHQLLRDSPNIKMQIERLSVGSIMSGLSSSVVQKLVFPIPSLAEQEKIAHFLKRVDKVIELHQRKCESLKELKKGMLQKMFPSNE